MFSCKNQLIHLMGPTASGKTDIAIALAQELPIEIISVDSALVYQNMDIGSAKPSAAVRAEVPHHLIDVVSPETPYSVAHFLRDAKRAVIDIQSRNKIPLFVGGTMFYFKALIEGLADIPEVPSEIRHDVQQKLIQQGSLALFNMLESVDPVSAARIHAHDIQRVTRALEVYEATGKPLTYWLQQTHLAEDKQPIMQLSLVPTDRPNLHKRLAERFDSMLAQGFIEEVVALQARYQLNEQLPSMRSVGYRQVWQYLAGSISHDEMRLSALAASRQLAKRQLTWLRSWVNHQIIPACQHNTLAQVKEIIVSRFDSA